MEKHLCQCCGAPLEKSDDYYECSYCGSRFEEDFEEKAAVRLVDVLNDAKMKSLANAKRVLYNAAHTDNVSNQAVSDAAFKVLAIDPDDLLANFYIVSLDKDPALLNRWLAQAPISPSIAEEVVSFELSGLDARNVFALKDYAERQFQGEKQLRIVSMIEDEAQRLSEGFYNPAFPRDVFLCYSSKDQFRVMEICDLLEENGFTVFAAYRNLRHGKGAADNYISALHQSMLNCKVVVFLSSKNSRSASCDALKVELPFINSNCPKMGRIEFIIDPYEEARPLPILVRQLLKESFAGLEWCKTEEDLVRRVFKYTSKQSRVCPRCGHENEPDSRFCHKCGEPLSEDAKASMRNKGQSNANADAKLPFRERMKEIVSSGVEAIKKASANAIHQSSSGRSEHTERVNGMHIEGSNVAYGDQNIGYVNNGIVNINSKVSHSHQSVSNNSTHINSKQTPNPKTSRAGRVLSLIDSIFAGFYLLISIAFDFMEMFVVNGSTTTNYNFFKAIAYIPGLVPAVVADVVFAIFNIILFTMAVKNSTKLKKGMVLCIIAMVVGFIGTGILIGNGVSYSENADIQSNGVIAVKGALLGVASWIMMLGAVIYGLRGLIRRNKK